MDVHEQSASVVLMASAASIADRILLCIDTDDSAVHVFTMNMEQAVSLIAQLEAAYCCKYGFPINKASGQAP